MSITAFTNIAGRLSEDQTHRRNVGNSCCLEVPKVYSKQSRSNHIHGANNKQAADVLFSIQSEDPIITQHDPDQGPNESDYNDRIIPLIPSK